MVRNFDTSPIERMKTADMPPAVVAYAEGVHRQLTVLLDELGVGSVAELQERYADDAKALMPHRAKVFQAIELTTVLKSAFTNPEGFMQERVETEMRTLFGDRYLGPEAAERACTLSTGEKVVTIDEGESKKAFEALQRRLQESAVARLIELCKRDPRFAKDWLLVYTPEEMVPWLSERGLVQKKVGIDGLYATLEADVRASGGDHILHDNPSPPGRDWARGALAWDGWRFVYTGGEDIVEDIDWTEQYGARYAQRDAWGIPGGGTFQAMSAPEVVFSLAVYFRETGKRLLGDRMTRTTSECRDPEAPHERLHVTVGNFDHEGIRLGDAADSSRRSGLTMWMQI